MSHPGLVALRKPGCPGGLNERVGPYVRPSARTTRQTRLVFNEHLDRGATRGLISMFNPQGIFMTSRRSVLVLSLVLPSTLCMHAASSSSHAHEKRWSPPGQYVLDIPQEESNFRIRNLAWSTHVNLVGQSRSGSTPSPFCSFTRLDDGERAEGDHRQGCKIDHPDQ
jgi:hypothetical protein